MGKRIAIIDDSSAFRLLVASLLDIDGFEVAPFPDAESFLSKSVKPEEFDLYLVDINLPGMNGLDMLSTLKTDARTASIPVLLLTGDATKARVKQAAGIGVAGYIAKPIDPESFVERVRIVLELG
ncbi:response regulator [Paenibacillus antri]|uniref:response regulator n=1 Tax=Paenibacillus antri TaxID=2582848 RepID=UPI0013051F1A|nr:response regulator [Paenibacillus antri]